MWHGITVEATYKGRFYKGTAAYKGTYTNHTKFNLSLQPRVKFIL